MMFVDQNIDLRGAPMAFWQSALGYDGPLIKREVLCAGPGGTGKSRGFMQTLAYMGEMNPGMRILLTRASRESMTSSTLVQFERCWPDGHEILDGPAREGRSIYHHPNGTEYAAIGLDKPGKLFSTEWDAIYGEELTGDGTPQSDIAERTWGLFFRGLRGNRPFNGQHFLIGTANPSYPQHWMRQRMLRAEIVGGTLIETELDGGEYRLSTYPTRLDDNPVYHTGLLLPDGGYDPNGRTAEGRAYIAGLKRIPSEHDRRRLLDGEWCVAEGRAFPEFDRAVHVVTGRIEREPWKHRLHVDGWAKPVDIEWYFVSMDFGYRKPGVAQVWAVDQDGRMFRVAEIYENSRQLDWWADKLNQLKKLYPFTVGVGDSAEPRTIDFFNDRLGFLRDRDGPRIRKSDKTRGKIFGFDQLRWGFSEAEGGPRLFILKDAFPFGRDTNLARAGKPTCFEDELDRAIWRRARSENDAVRNKEELDPACEDHAIDAAAYGAVYAWNKSLGRNPSPIERAKPGTYAATFTSGGKPLDYPDYAWMN